MAGRVEGTIVVGWFIVARSGIVAADSSNVPSGSGINFANWGHALLDVVMTGSVPSVEITPQYWNTHFGTYVDGQARTITGTSAGVYVASTPFTQRLVVEVDSWPDVYFKITAMTGSTPVMHLYAIPTNRFS